MAAHDSVLQTLAMVQRSAGDPSEGRSDRPPPGARAARLAGREAGTGAGARLAAALEAAAADVEERCGVPVEVVVVGDRLDGNRGDRRGSTRGDDERGEVRRPLDGGRVRRERRRPHPGVRARPWARFDPAGVPGDRRGVRESIVGRMERHGGRARVTSAPGGGTEVELVLEERQ